MRATPAPAVELSLPFDLLKQQRLDSLCNDTFRAYVRAAILGENVELSAKLSIAAISASPTSRRPPSTSSLQ
jgi:hypothetical protein